MQVPGQRATGWTVVSAGARAVGVRAVGVRAVGIRVDSGQCGCRGSGRWTKYWAVRFATMYQGG